MKIEHFKSPNLIKQSWLTPSKWILAGEHSVLRGGEALVFPMFSKSMAWEYTPSAENFKISFSGETASDLGMIFSFVLDKACDVAGVDKKNLKGSLRIDSNILFGMGLGASASLAVGLGKLFNAVFDLKLDEIEFAQKIENYFHGESSGVDVAVVAHQKPLIFKRSGKIDLISNYRLPLLTLSHCGRRGPTKECVEKVKELFAIDKSHAEKIDQRMNETIQTFKSLLTDGSRESWKVTIEKAHSCFEDWGLVPEEARQHIQMLKENGAVACKMTGSGGGGYILSLWDHRSDFKEIKTIIPLDQKVENSLG